MPHEVIFKEIIKNNNLSFDLKCYKNNYLSSFENFYDKNIKDQFYNLFSYFKKVNDFLLRELRFQMRLGS